MEEEAQGKENSRKELPRLLTTMRFKDQKIYMWRTNELVRELALGHVSELQKAIYLAVDLVLILCLFYIFTPPTPNSVFVMYAESILIFAITAIGVFVSFRENGAGKEKYFIEYFVCLTLPLFVRVNIIVWSIYGVIYHITGVFLSDIPEKYYDTVDLVDELATSLSIIIVAVTFFALMANNIRKIRSFVDHKQAD